MPLFLAPLLWFAFPRSVSPFQSWLSPVSDSNNSSCSKKFLSLLTMTRCEWGQWHQKTYGKDGFPVSIILFFKFISTVHKTVVLLGFLTWHTHCPIFAPKCKSLTQNRSQINHFGIYRENWWLLQQQQRPYQLQAQKSLAGYTIMTCYISQFQPQAL